MKFLQNNKWRFSLVLLIILASVEIRAQPDLMLLTPYSNQQVDG